MGFTWTGFHFGTAELRRASETPENLLRESRLFPVDPPRHSPYVPRNFEGGIHEPAGARSSAGRATDF